MPLTGDNSASRISRLKNFFAALCVVFVLVLALGLSLGAGVDPFLAVVMGVVIVILLTVNTYLVVLWSDPGDASASVWHLLLLVLSLTLAQAAVLGLPLDVANNGGSLQCTDDYTGSSSSFERCGNLDMKALWTTVIALLFVFVVVLLPVALFHYEAYDEVDVGGRRTTGCGALVVALKSEVYVVLFVGLLLGLMYGFLGTAEVPVTVLKMDVVSAIPSQAVLRADVGTEQGRAAFTAADLFDAEAAGETCVSGDCYSTKDGSLEVSTSFFTYVAALMGWAGYFVFVLFGGIGLASLPIDLVRTFVYRPRVKSREALAKMHKALQAKTNELVKLGAEMKRQREDPAAKAAAKAAAAAMGWRERARVRAEDRTNVNKFKQMVFVLERDCEAWEVSRGSAKGYNPLWPYAALALGILAALLSALWVTHLVLYLLIDPPAANFLNAYFIQFSQWFDLFGIISVAVFAAYLYACVMAGVFKVGVRCFCMTLHPMRLGKTLTNAFLFNALWLLLCVLPVVHFCADAFASYARFTDIGVLVGVQIKYLALFNAFFASHAFVYCLVILAGLTFLALLRKPTDAPADAQRLKRAVRSRR